MRRPFQIRLILQVTAGGSFAGSCIAPSGGGSNELPIVNPSLSRSTRISLR